MLRPATHIRYHIAGILVVDPVFSGAAHWIQFVANKNIHGETLEIDPKILDPDTEVIRF